MKDLNEFLDDGTPELAPAPEPVVVVEPVVEPVVVEKPAGEKPAGEDIADDVPDDVVKLRAALVATRRDHKGRADRAEGEAAALRAQLAELQKARSEPPAPVAPPQQVQPQPLPQAPNPQEDPQGYADWVENIQFNRRANISEHAIRADKSITDLTPKIAAFMEAKATDPLLEAQLKLAPDPWRWAYEQGGKIIANREEAAKQAAMLSEIGTDPEAYAQKRIAEARAKWEAEMAATPRAPEPVLPQSLAGVRNAGERTQTQETVPEFEDIFKRKPR